MLDNRNHEGTSINEKLVELMKPSNFIKLVLVQQQELETINSLRRIKDPKQSAYIDQLYKHYIIENKPKMCGFSKEPDNA